RRADGPLGYPHGQENDAERAVRAALAIQRALDEINAKNAGRGALQLSARIGLESGPVVVEGTGEGFGEGPNCRGRFSKVFCEAQLRIMQYEASRIYRGLLDLPQELVGPKFREMLGIGLTLSEATYRDDRMRLATARVRFWATFADADAILFPATPQTAP